jgi:tetratricopeptide (TPR) repeat protein
MQTLIIKHVADSEPVQFQLVRKRDDNSTDPRGVVSPFGFPVEERPDSDLVEELAWYLEKFLDYPFSPETEHAERVLASLRAWGEQAFNALFGDKEGWELFEEATREGYERLHLVISSDDPRVLSWPWEALQSPKIGVLAQTCQIERDLNQIPDPQPISDKLPTGQVNILLVTARPYERDIHYRSISRPLVELIQKEKLPAHLHVLRPPTFDRLKEHLKERPYFYHLIHFDGHGSLSTGAHDRTLEFTMPGGQGQLIFENDEGRPRDIKARYLSMLMREHSIPCMVVNACQSATFAVDAQDPFAAVSVALLQAGIRSVVAMAWSLHVNAGQQFLAAFYRKFFEIGSVAQAARAGRQQMHKSPNRVCARGDFPLQDWLVPVLYQHDPYDFSFTAAAAVESKDLKLPEEVQDQNNPYGFVGRDGAVLKLERAMRRGPAGILIQGLGGVGKTTLARGFVRWLAATDGLANGCFWFRFGDIRSAEFVFNRLGEALFGVQFSAAAPARRTEALIKIFREQQFLMVWDNFEVVQGIPGTPVEPTMPEPDRHLLLGFLQKLSGGRSKVLITSRSKEDWLGVESLRISLGGLQGDERWEYCERILSDLGISIDREDENLVKVMDLLGGHPLAMRVILPKLETLTATEVVTALKTNLEALNISGGDEAQAKLYATLQFAPKSLPDPLRSLLTPLAMHEGFVDADYLEKIAKQVDTEWQQGNINSFLDGLAAAGLLRDRGQSVYEMHAILTTFLRATWLASIRNELRDCWARAFVEIMARLAESLVSRELQEQRAGFHWHSANFYYATNEAQRLSMDREYRALLQAVAAYATKVRNYQIASELYTRLAQAASCAGDEKMEAAGYHQLGTIAQEQHDFKVAAEWYCKSLVTNERRGNERGAAITCYELGRMAQVQGDSRAAEGWHHKSLAINERLGDEYVAAITYHQLGRIKEERRDFEAAEEWYRKSLVISEKLRADNTAAITCHQLGVIAQAKGAFRAAEGWYRKSLAINEKQGRGYEVGVTYHQLGRIKEEQGDLDAAEKWYRKSLAIKEKQGDERGAAMTYHHMGTTAEERRDFKAAEEWHRKSLAISERLRDEDAAAMTYHQLGIIAHHQGYFKAAEEWYRKSLAITEKLGNEYAAAITYNQLGVTAQEQGYFKAAEEWYRKSLAIKEKQSDQYSAADTYGNLGILEGVQEHYEQAGQLLVKALLAFATNNNLHRFRMAKSHFIGFYQRADIDARSKLKAMWEEAGLGLFPNS